MMCSFGASVPDQANTNSPRWPFTELGCERCHRGHSGDFNLLQWRVTGQALRGSKNFVTITASSNMSWQLLFTQAYCIR